MGEVPKRGEPVLRGRMSRVPRGPGCVACR